MSDRMSAALVNYELTHIKIKSVHGSTATRHQQRETVHGIRSQQEDSLRVTVRILLSSRLA